VICASFDRSHSKLPPRMVRAPPGGWPAHNHASAAPITQRHTLTRQSGPAIPPQQSRTPGDGLVLVKLACQAGFVISFYDLSETGDRATVQRCTDASSTGSPPPGQQHIDKTDGAQPASLPGGGANG
jgi:hypothetical protein